MARKIIWFRLAEKDQEDILSYWKKRNKSVTYSKLLRQKFSEMLLLAAINPNIGQAYNLKDTRYILFRDYKIFYSYTKDTITVLRIWDTRRNPEELRIK